MRRAWLVVVLGLGAGLLLLIGGFTMGWWTYADGELEVAIGLREARMCRPGQSDRACSAVSLQRLISGDDVRWLRAGTGSYAVAWMAAMLSLAMAGLRAAGKASRLLARTGLVAAVSAGVVGALFVAWAPADVAREAGYGMGLYFGGAALAAACAVLGLRGARPS